MKDEWGMGRGGWVGDGVGWVGAEVRFLFGWLVG